MKTVSSKIAVTFLLSLGLSAFSFAEDAKPGAPGGPGGRMDPEARANEMKTQLGLSDEQTGKVKAVYEKSREKNMAEFKKMKDDTSLSEQDKRKKMGEMMMATMEEIKPILTPEQQAKFKEIQEKRREEMKKRREAK